MSYEAVGVLMEVAQITDRSQGVSDASEVEVRCRAWLRSLQSCARSQISKLVLTADPPPFIARYLQVSVRRFEWMCGDGVDIVNGDDCRYGDCLEVYR